MRISAPRSRDDIGGVIRRFLRAVVSALAAATIAAMVTGLYLRVAMRILVAGNDSYNGAVSDHEGAVYGRWTWDGTWAITNQVLFFAWFIGIPLYALLRRVIGGQPVIRGLAFGLLLLGLGGQLVLDPSTFEFVRFITPIYAIALFAGSYLVYGLLHATIADAISRPVPVVRWRLVRWPIEALFGLVMLLSTAQIVAAWAQLRAPLLPVAPP
jgi:hypothetical protein